MYESFRAEIIDRHDNYCNQKYEERDGFVQLPYSFHLIATECIAKKYALVVFGEDKLNSKIDDGRVHDMWGGEPTFYDYILCVAIAHDCLEDARMTINDLKEMVKTHFKGDSHLANLVAMSCYRLTDEKGLNRDERKNQKYYAELVTDEVATFIKMCDRLANIMYGKMMGGTMLNKYKKENPNFLSKLHKSVFDPILEEIYTQLYLFKES